MDLIKLQKKLTEQLKTEKPDCSSHSVTIKIEISYATKVDLFAWWKLPAGQLSKENKDYDSFYAYNARSLKAAVKTFNEELLKLNNKLEIKE